MSMNREALSALMDAESSELELRRVLKTQDDSEDLGDTWRRYHLARALLREQRVDSTIDISGGVMAAIEAQEQVPAVRKQNKRGFWQATGSLAAAASVTLAVLLGVQYSSLDQSADSLAQAGYIKRQQSSEYIVPTALSGTSATGTEQGDAIEVLRLSQGLAEQISRYRTLSVQTVPDWQVNWVPEGFNLAGTRVTDSGETRIFSRDQAIISVSLETRTDQTPAAGVLTDHNLVSVGRDLDNAYVSVVGELSLNEADRIASSVSLETRVE